MVDRPSFGINNIEAICLDPLGLHTGNGSVKKIGPFAVARFSSMSYVEDGPGKDSVVLSFKDSGLKPIVVFRTKS